MKISAIEKMLLQIEADLGIINKTFSIMSCEQQKKLWQDIKYVFMDHIAKEIRFAFYDQRNKRIIFHQYVYKSNGDIQSSGDMDLLENMKAEHIAFDVFIEFTDAFLSMDSKFQDILLKNTEYEWYM